MQQAARYPFVYLLQREKMLALLKINILEFRQSNINLFSKLCFNEDTDDKVSSHHESKWTLENDIVSFKHNK